MGNRLDVRFSPDVDRLSRCWKEIGDAAKSLICKMPISR